MLKLPVHTGPQRETCKPFQIWLTADGQTALLQLRQHLGGTAISDTIEAAMTHAVTTLRVPAPLT